MSNIDLITAPIGGSFTYAREIEDALRKEIAALQSERARCEQEAINLRRLLNAVLTAKGTDGVLTLSDEATSSGSARTSTPSSTQSMTLVSAGEHRSGPNRVIRHEGETRERCLTRRGVGVAILVV